MSDAAAAHSKETARDRGCMWSCPVGTGLCECFDVRGSECVVRIQSAVMRQQARDMPESLAGAKPGKNSFLRWVQSYTN
jgi:hypothetical protein